jgi:transposase-like protein
MVGQHGQESTTKKSRRRFSAEFKAKVVLEALKDRITIEELARKHELHPTQINTWKREAIANMAFVFSGDKSEGHVDIERQTEKLYAQIGQLKVENDFLKKKLF